MGIFDGCLLASDIDGTLIESGYINPRNVEAVDYFISEGGMFSLSTGRFSGAVSDVTSKLNRVSPSVVANGCVIYDFENSRLVYETVLPAEDLHLAEHIINTSPEVGLEIYCREQAFTVKRTERMTLHQNYEKFTAPDISFSDACVYSWNKAIFAFESEREREEMFEGVKDSAVKCGFIKTSAVINGEIQYYMEMVPKNVSKASALKILCEKYGIKKGSLFAIGDYYNDLEMIKNADISAVPFTSPEDIKQYADYITCSCDNGAVADFINYLKCKFNV